MVSLNVHAWRDRRRRSNTRRVAALVRDLRPHVLCLQAFVPPPHRSARPAPLSAALHSLMSTCCGGGCRCCCIIIGGGGAGGAGAATLVRG
jgi:hypothetical protein